MLIITLSSILGLMLIGGAFWFGIKTGVAATFSNLTWNEDVQLHALKIIGESNKNAEIEFTYE